MEFVESKLNLGPFGGFISIFFNFFYFNSHLKLPSLLFLFYFILFFYV